MKALTSLAWMFGVIGLVASPGRILAQTDVPSASPKNSEATNQVPLPEKVKAKAEPAAKSTDLSQSPHLSPWLAEVVKLSKAKVDEGVIVAYIDAAGTFNLGAEQIIYLRDQGLANEIIGAILEHDYELLSGQRPIPVSIAPESGPAVQLAASSKSGLVKVSPAQGPPTSPPSVQASPAPGLASFEPSPAYFNEEEGLGPYTRWALLRQNEAPPTEPGFSPVRQPYAVKLTDPIFIFR